MILQFGSFSTKTMCTKSFCRKWLQSVITKCARHVRQRAQALLDILSNKDQCIGNVRQRTNVARLICPTSVLRKSARPGECWSSAEHFVQHIRNIFRNHCALQYKINSFWHFYAAILIYTKSPQCDTQK